MTRLRNLEYMAETGVRLSASGFRSESKSTSGPSKERTDEDVAPANPRSLDCGGTLFERSSSARDDNAEEEPSFHENSPQHRSG